MDEVLHRFKQGKFQKCLELIKILPETDDLVNNFVIENCKLVCESLATLSANDPDKIYEMQEELYLFFDRVTSTGMITDLPIELRLTVTFNFIFWLLFYNDSEINDFEVEEYFELINRGLLRVLGRQVSSVHSLTIAEQIMENLSSLKMFIKEESRTLVLVVELVIIVVLYVIKLERKLLGKCLSVVDEFVEECKGARVGMSVSKFLQVDTQPLCLFKFCLRKAYGLLSYNLDVLDYLYVLQSVILYLLGNNKGSLKCLQGQVDSCVKSLWSYLVVLNAFELQMWDLCLGFLNRTSNLVLERNLKVRFHLIRGKLYAVERNHKLAVEEFQAALCLSDKCPLVYYYLGEEYGRMGIHDMMVENFQKLVQLMEDDDDVLVDDFKPSFEMILLDWIHPPDEVTESEVYYSLAVGYGLTEDFKRAGEAFEKVIQTPMEEKLILGLPNSLTILHEAAVMNLQSGNLVRAEQIAWDAIDRYVPERQPKKGDQKRCLLSKDVEWLQRVIQQELLENDLEPKELQESVLYSEELTFGLQQNVIGLLILSEIQKFQGMDDYKVTLSNVFSLFSKHLATTHRKDLNEDEEHALTLIKALAGKTCLKIVAEQTKSKDDASVEKMFKRALSCNKGDKDALCSYYNFLSAAGRRREAVKLWKTFAPYEDTISTDAVQSFSLRYFLKNKITNRDLEKIQKEVESMSTLS